MDRYIILLLHYLLFFWVSLLQRIRGTDPVNTVTASRLERA